MEGQQDVLRAERQPKAGKCILGRLSRLGELASEPLQARQNV